MPHMEHSFIINCRSCAEMIFTDSDTGNAGQNLCHVMDGFIRTKVFAVGNDRDESGDGAIRCFSHIFRESIDPEKQIRYLEKEGVSVTAHTIDQLDDCNEAQVVWADPKMKREYHQMKAERDACIEKIYGFKSENDGLKSEYDRLRSRLDLLKGKYPEIYHERTFTFIGKQER